MNEKIKTWAIGCWITVDDGSSADVHHYIPAKIEDVLIDGDGQAVLVDAGDFRLIKSRHELFGERLFLSKEAAQRDADVFNASEAAG